MTDYLASAKELLAVVDNLHGDELDQAQDLERGASAHALVDIAESLRRLNDGRDQFHREVLEVLTQAKGPEAPLRCEVCGKPGHVPRCLIGPLTREQWKTHHAWLYQRCMDNGGYKAEASRSATDKMHDTFGPCPKEGP
jgi:hypothetical protein